MEDPIILTVFSVAMLLVYGTLLVVYSREPWRRHAFGRAMMGLIVAVLSFSVVAVLRQVFGADYWGREWLLGASRVIVIVVGISITGLLIRQRRRDHGSTDG